MSQIPTKFAPIVSTLLLLALLACGVRPSSPKAGTTPVPTQAAVPSLPTPVSPFSPQLSATLRSYALTDSDLPDGDTLGFTLDVPNQQAALDFADPADAQKEVKDTGRLAGIGQQVQTPPGDPSTIGVSVELFGDAAGAQQWATNPPALPSELSPSQVSLDQPPGDHAGAVHWTQAGKAGYVLSFSRGKVVFGIGVSAPAGKESLAPALELARRLDSNAQKRSS